MTHMNEHGLTSMASDRIGGFHREAAARQVARQAQTDRTRFRFVAALVRLPGTLLVQKIELPLRKAAFNVAVKFLALVSRITGAEQETSPS